MTDNAPSSIEPPAPHSTSEAVPLKRPRSVTLLVIGVLIITVINLTRFVLSMREWGFLVTQPGVSPLYLALTGLVWTIAGTFLVWGLWVAKGWAPRLMEALGLTYALYYWLDLLFLRDHPVSDMGIFKGLVLPTNWQFSAGVTIICLAYMAWTLGRLMVKAYFGLADTGTMLNHAEGNSNKKSNT